MKNQCCTIDNSKVTCHLKNYSMDIVRRRRRCLTCNRAFHTVEVDMPTSITGPKSFLYISPFLKAIRKAIDEYVL